MDVVVDVFDCVCLMELVVCNNAARVLVGEICSLEVVVFVDGISVGCGVMSMVYGFSVVDGLVCIARLMNWYYDVELIIVLDMFYSNVDLVVYVECLFCGWYVCEVIVLLVEGAQVKVMLLWVFGFDWCVVFVGLLLIALLEWLFEDDLLFD